MNIEQIARVAHEVNKAYCEALGGMSQTNWFNAPEGLKAVTMNGVRFVLDNPRASLGLSHNNWVKEKKAAGWTLGLVKNVEKKLHPCIMPYVDLPQEQQTKEHLFRGTVRALSIYYNGLSASIPTNVF